MEIGTIKRTRIIAPLSEPVPQRKAEPAPERPVVTPAPEREAVPA